MPHKLTFYPLGNADTCLTNLDNGRVLLFDYAHCREQEKEDDPRADLKAILTTEFEERANRTVDVVAFTHADEDHIRGATEFFYLDFAKKYQDDDRVRIDELWVPAAFILETGLTSEAKIIQSEARHRLKEGYGVRVFSRPDGLKAWLAEQNIDLEDRRSMISDAGTVVPGFTIENDGVELFVHSPFAFRQEEELIDRNADSLVVQLTFVIKKQDTCAILGADTPFQSWQDIVKITRGHKREQRLLWDIFKLPHHCSYGTLSEEKGEKKTDPVEECKWLFSQGRKRGIIVSCSEPIPNIDTDQPPHMQAANYYRDVAGSIEGSFIVTMEHPDTKKPKPVVILIGEDGAKIEKKQIEAAAIVSTTSAPRAGSMSE